MFQSNLNKFEKQFQGILEKNYAFGSVCTISKKTITIDF